MSHRFSAAAASCVLACVVSSAPAKADDFPRFWSAFARAAAENDKAAIQAMIKFPFFDGELRQAAEFEKAYKADFGPKARACLAKAKPKKVRGGDQKDAYAVFCGDRIYSFTQAGGVWRLSDVDAND